MKRISVAFGSHDHAVAALKWAVELATATGAPLEVVGVFDPAAGEDDPDQYDDVIVDRRQQIAEITADLQEATGQVSLRDRHEPIEEFAEHLDEGRGSLGVISAHERRRTLTGRGMNQPAHRVLHHTRQPVAVIRPSDEPVVGGILAVGVDGSEANGAAVAWSARVAVDCHATLHAVMAYDPTDDSFTRAEQRQCTADEVFASLARANSAAWAVFMTAGDASEVLIEHARRVRAAAIVVGTRGRGGFGRLRLGRVPSHLLAHATCPVIVVPH